MTYAAQLIDAVKAAKGLKTYRAVAEALGVHEVNVSQWRKGVGSPMPEDRVLQLCEMAHIADAGPWLVGIQADGTKGAARRALDSVLDRVRPAVATVGTLVVALLVVYALPSNSADTISALALLAIPERLAAYTLCEVKARQAMAGQGPKTETFSAHSLGLPGGSPLGWPGDRYLRRSA